MNDTAPDSLIPYDEIVQEALRGVVGRVLGEIAAAGGELPGNHHFYITFKTGAAGVAIPAHLKQRFPDEMTIVLQNKFWNLAVGDDRFAVELSFNGIPAKLAVPFAAITAFVDPAVDFGLQFQAIVVPEEEAAKDTPARAGAGNDAGNAVAGEGDPGDAAAGGDAAGGEAGDGSNVVTVDFGKKK